MSLFERRPLCNNNPSSAPIIYGKTFFLCWRCCGAAVGILIVMITYTFVPIFKCNRTLMIILIFPAMLDYVMNRINVKKPSNKIRFLTGILLGNAVGMMEILLMNLIS